jgi:hypothetical protein
MKRLTASIAVLIITSLPACGGKNPVAYNPVINPAEFVAAVDHPYFSLAPGTTFIYTAETDAGTETNKVRVTHDTKVILGVPCVVVADSVWLEGELIEATFDWYTQHQDGAVWYFGEDVDNFENGALVDHEGTWEAGVDGAKPGIVMAASPRVGDSYRQEFYEGEAEDMAEVMSVNESATVPAGAFHNCVKTREWTPLEPDIESHKFYAPGVGFVLEIHTRGSSERVELVSISTE